MSSNKNNIAILIYSLSGGGAERVVTYLIKYLRDHNKQPILFLMNDNIDYEIDSSVPIYYLEKSNASETGFKKILKIPFLAYRYHRLIREHKIEISISFLSRPNYINLINTFFRRKTKIIVSERSFPSQQYGDRSLKSLLNNFLIKSLYPKADIIICNSNGNACDLINNYGINSRKIRVIYNPIDYVKISKIDGIEHFFDTSYTNFITVGRLDENKNHYLLIEALNKLKQSNIRLYIFGKGPLKSKIQSQIKLHGLSNQIFLMGFDSNPYKFLKKADAFVFSSKSEGFPNVLLEALACELPIISTNCKSGPDEILLGRIEDITDIRISDLGILVPSDNLQLMVKALDYYINNKHIFEHISNKSSERLISFEPDQILSKYFECL